MLTQTTELAVKTLVLLALEGDDHPVSPSYLAERLDCSKSYLAKTLRTLVAAGILRSIRGARGGVVLEHSPQEISLLAVVEACQGMLVGDYCREAGDPRVVCSFHRAMKQLHTVVVETLKSWTLQDLLAHPAKPDLEADGLNCRMRFEGCEKYSPFSK